MIKVIGKNGMFLLVKKGRLASDAEVVSALTDILKNVTAGETLQLDAGAVALLKVQAANGDLA